MNLSYCNRCKPPTGFGQNYTLFRQMQAEVFYPWNWGLN